MAARACRRESRRRPRSRAPPRKQPLRIGERPAARGHKRHPPTTPARSVSPHRRARNRTAPRAQAPTTRAAPPTPPPPHPTTPPTAPNPGPNTTPPREQHSRRAPHPRPRPTHPEPIKLVHRRRNRKRNITMRITHPRHLNRTRPRPIPRPQPRKLRQQRHRREGDRAGRRSCRTRRRHLGALVPTHVREPTDRRARARPRESVATARPTNAGFTASTYAHMFEQARHADELRERMADGYGRLLTMSTNCQPAPATSRNQHPRRSLQSAGCAANGNSPQPSAPRW